MPAIYCGTSFAVCLLEVLVHANRKSPPSGARCVEAVVPGDVSREVFPEAAHAGWDHPFDVSVAQGFGRDWLAAGRSAVLVVPSVVTGGRDRNVVVNTEHPEAGRIAVGAEGRVVLDPRLFGR